MRTLNILFAFMILAGFSSCLKESPRFDPAKSPGVIEIHQRIPDLIGSPTSSTYPLFRENFVIADESNFDVIIKYVGPDVAPEDITVTLEIDPSVLDIYNAENGAHLVMLPEALYTVSTFTVTIPKGQREAIWPIKLKSNQFSFSEQYGLPLVIKSASSGNISGNFGTVIYNVGPKNQWDGVYDNTFETIGLAGNGHNTVTLTTVNATRVKFGLIGVYSNEVFLDIDPATNLVTVSMTSLLPIATDPSSHYDPATKTFHILFTTNGGGRTIKQTMVREE